MPITYRQGDLLACSEKVLAHGCNAMGVMGSGVASLIRNQYPAAYAAYRHAHASAGLPLGTVVWVDTFGKLIANCITQNDFGRQPGRVYADYEAIRSCMREIDRMMVEHGLDAVALPLIGAGLAQGHWPTIAAIIEEEAQHFQPVVYTLDGVIPS